MVVTVACINYNQGKWLTEAVESVMNQTYRPVELWILDNGSTDGSRQIIHGLKQRFPDIHSYLSEENIGHTAIFNQFLPHFKGEYIVDLAADDLLFPDRLARGMEAFHGNPGCGVNFTNAELIDQDGKHLAYHYPVDDTGKARRKVPEGDVFTKVVGEYFINPVSMMIRREVFDRLGGYDAALSYEDFDFWVRSARHFSYCYTDAILVSKRIHPASYSSTQYRSGSVQMKDTLRVCRKLKGQLETGEEWKAWHRRMGYEMRQCLRTGNLTLFFKYLMLLQ